MLASEMFINRFMLASEMFINRSIHLIENGEPDTASETKFKAIHVSILKQCPLNLYKLCVSDAIWLADSVNKI